MNPNPLIDYIESMESRFEAMQQEIYRLKSEVDRLRKNITPEIVVGPTAAAEIINAQTTNRPMSARAVTNYVALGKIPTNGMKGKRHIFDCSELIAWDRAGRPRMSVFLSSKI